MYFDAAMTRLLPILVAFTLIAQLGQAAHFTLVEHTVCAEHGELVHREPDAAADTHAADDDDGARRVATNAHGDGAAHDHCASVGHGRDSILPARIDTIVIADAAPQTFNVRPQYVFVARDILDVAPKSSPPSA